VTGRELRRIRRQLGLTQVEMAQRLGLTNRSLGRYERSERPITKVMAIAVRCLAHHGPGR
jgi:transcriptional regulator with XRE-family HTH domain